MQSSFFFIVSDSADDAFYKCGWGNWRKLVTGQSQWMALLNGLLCMKMWLIIRFKKMLTNTTPWILNCCASSKLCMWFKVLPLFPKLLPTWSQSYLEAVNMWVGSIPGAAGRRRAWSAAGTKYSEPDSAAQGRKLESAASDIPLSDPVGEKQHSSGSECIVFVMIQDFTIWLGCLIKVILAKSYLKWGAK